MPARHRRLAEKCAASKFPVSHPFKLTPAQPKLTQPPIHSTSTQPRIHFTPIERRTLSLLCKPTSSRIFDFQFRTSHIRSIYSKFIHLSVPFLYVRIFPILKINDGIFAMRTSDKCGEREQNSLCGSAGMKHLCAHTGAP